MAARLDTVGGFSIHKHPGLGMARASGQIPVHIGFSVVKDHVVVGVVAVVEYDVPGFPGSKGGGSRNKGKCCDCRQDKSGDPFEDFAFHL